MSERVFHGRRCRKLPGKLNISRTAAAEVVETKDKVEVGGE
jgi:hypothetical protein